MSYDENILSPLIFIGCSSTYIVSDFSSKDKFYEDFNKSANNKIVKITLNNDSSFTVPEGAKVLNDTLSFFSQKGNVNKDILPINRVKEISYKNHLLGVPFGFVVGTVLGGLELSVDAQEEKGNSANFIWYPIGTIILGSALGWYVGYTYQFTP